MYLCIYIKRLCVKPLWLYKPPVTSGGCIKRKQKKKLWEFNLNVGSLPKASGPELHGSHVSNLIRTAWANRCDNSSKDNDSYWVKVEIVVVVAKFHSSCSARVEIMYFVKRFDFGAHQTQHNREQNLEETTDWNQIHIQIH